MLVDPVETTSALANCKVYTHPELTRVRIKVSTVSFSETGKNYHD